jgi:hypothetical protein
MNTIYDFKSRHLAQAFLDELGVDERVEIQHETIIQSESGIRLSIWSVPDRDRRFVLETEWNKALAHAKAQLQPFKEGDWVYHTNNKIAYKISKENAHSRDHWSCMIHTEYTALCESFFRKATPKEIEATLLQEAERRYKHGDLVKSVADPNRNYRIDANCNHRYWADEDTFLFGGIEVFNNGKWLEHVKTNKFFAWDVEHLDEDTIKIGCSEFDYSELHLMYNVLSKLTQEMTLKQLLKEVDDKLDIPYIREELPF